MRSAFANRALAVSPGPLGVWNHGLLIGGSFSTTGVSVKTKDPTTRPVEKIYTIWMLWRSFTRFASFRMIEIFSSAPSNPGIEASGMSTAFLFARASHSSRTTSPKEKQEGYRHEHGAP